MTDTAASLSEHRRKRVRKGTKSCWECKRRKIRCDYLDSETVCAGCLDRGSKCVSQEFVDDQAPPSGTQLGQRMGRVEMLLEKLMQKVDSSSSNNNNGSNNNGNSGSRIGLGGSVVERDPHGLGVSEARESLGIDVLTPSSSSSNHYETAPILSLFDNAVFGRSPADGAASARSESAMYASPPTSISQATSPVSRTQSKLERLRRSLIAILPSQHDVDILLNVDGWFLISRHVLPLTLNMPDHDFSRPFSVQGVSQAHPIVMARLLLVVVLCIQQLPYDYDQSQLQLVDPLKDRRDLIVNTIAKVTSDDELIGSMEGIECLILQGVYHINCGNLRRSWLCFRRATNIAQLMGLHRPSLKPNDPEDVQAQRKHYLWFQLVKGDRFLSLILGVPSAGSSSEQFPFDDDAKWLTVEDRYNKHLSVIAGLIVDRNQGEPTHAFSATQNIDEKLDNVAKQMPSSWWELPDAVTFERNDTTIDVFDRALVQIYHYELESLVHLPYMLRAAVDRRYEYSRLSCLSASRKLIHAWLYLRQGSKAPFICKIIDFQAFKSSVTLLLGILQPSQIIKDPLQIQQEEKDRRLVSMVRNIFEALLGLEENDIVLRQGAEVLKTLEDIDLNDHRRDGNMRLTIPHFGTITVGRSRCKLTTASEGTVRPALSVPGAMNANANSNANASVNSNLNVPYQQLDPALQNWQSSASVPVQRTYPTPPPVLTFTSSQFPPLTADMGEWPFNEDDTLLFDSLLNTDLEGNWNF